MSPTAYKSPAKTPVKAGSQARRRNTALKGRITLGGKIQKPDFNISSDEVNCLQQSIAELVAESDDGAVFGADEHGSVSRLASRRIRKPTAKVTRSSDDDYSPSKSTRSKAIKKESSDILKTPKSLVKGAGIPNNGRHKGRQLIRWTPYTKDLLLLCIQFQMTQMGIGIPYMAIAQQMFPEKKSSGQAIIQMLNKLRKSTWRRNAWVPPLPGRLGDDHKFKKEMRGFLKLKEDPKNQEERQIGWNEDCSSLIEDEDIVERRRQKRGPKLIAGMLNRRPDSTVEAMPDPDLAMDLDPEDDEDIVFIKQEKSTPQSKARTRKSKASTRRSGRMYGKARRNLNEDPVTPEPDSEPEDNTCDSGMDTFFDEEDATKKLLFAARFNANKSHQTSMTDNIKSYENIPLGYHRDKEDEIRYSDAVIGEDRYISSSSSSSSDSQSESDHESEAGYESGYELVDGVEVEVGKEVELAIEHSELHGSDLQQHKLGGSQFDNGVTWFDDTIAGGTLDQFPMNTVNFTMDGLTSQTDLSVGNNNFLDGMNFNFDLGNQLEVSGSMDDEHPVEDPYWRTMINEFNVPVLKSDVSVNAAGEIRLAGNPVFINGQKWLYYYNTSGQNGGVTRFRLIEE